MQRSFFPVPGFLEYWAVARLWLASSCARSWSGKKASLFSLYFDLKLANSIGTHTPAFLFNYSTLRDGKLVQRFFSFSLDYVLRHSKLCCQRDSIVRQQDDAENLHFTRSTNREQHMMSGQTQISSFFSSFWQKENLFRKRHEKN